MLFKQTALYVTFILLLTQTTSMHGITIFGYDFDVTPRLSALYSSIQNYMWSPWSNDSIHEERDANTMQEHLRNRESGRSVNVVNFQPKVTIDSIDLTTATPEQIELFMQDPTNIAQLRKEISNGINQISPADLEVLLRSPDLANCIKQSAIDSFSRICNNWSGLMKLRYILDLYPDTAQAFIQPTIDNFSQMYCNLFGMHIIEKILKCYPDAAKAFTKSAVENFSRMYKYHTGIVILEDIMRYNPDSAQAFIKPTIDNFSQICNDDEGYNILEIILNHCPNTAQAFAQLTINNFFQICNKKYASKIQEVIFKYYPDVTKMFAKQHASDPRVFYPFNDLVTHKTQTKQHLSAHLMDKYGDLSSQGFINYQDYDELQKMIKRVIDLEHTEQQKDRYTFVHAHQWAYHFYQELYTDLWSIINEKPNNYRFIRFRYPKKPSLEAFFIYIQKEQETRQKIMAGAVGQYYIQAGYQSHLLFMNYALFANPGFS